MGIIEQSISVTTTGVAGSATGTATSEPISGQLLAVKVDYHASAPDTTTVDIDEVGGMARKLVDLAASKTDIVFHPALQATDNTGLAIAGTYVQPYIPGRRVTVTVALSDALTNAVVVTLLVQEMR